MPPADSDRVDESNATTGTLPDELLHHPLFAAAKTDPAAIAIIHGDLTLTYGALVESALTLADTLRQLLTSDEHLVAIVMEKGNRTDRGRCRGPRERPRLPADQRRPTRPSDPRHPLPSRSAGCPNATLRRTGPVLAKSVVLVDVSANNVRTPRPARLSQITTPDDPAYVIYTSGSTGVPKGVTIQHRAARNTLADLGDRFALKPSDRVLWVSSLEFDLSIFDIFGILGAGGAVVVPAANSHRSPLEWAEAIHRHGVTVWNSVPAIAELMLAAAGDAASHLLDRLRLVMLSGDWIPLSLADRLLQQLPGCQLYSLGGATEASIWSIIFPIDHVEPEWVSVPYGRPLRNQSFRVLKDDLSACPIHTPGKLFIAGSGLAVGYWNDPKQTNARFIFDPKTGERLYDTGDFGQYRPDGTIEFLGREDNQVKLRGFRIELAEIEHALTQHPGLHNAVVVVDRKGEMNRLIAYVVPKRDRADRSPSGDGLDGVIADAVARAAFTLEEHGRPAIAVGTPSLGLPGATFDEAREQAFLRARVTALSPPSR